MDKKIKLLRPFEQFDHEVTEITLKEPKSGLYLKLGDPRIAVMNSESRSVYFVEQPAVISGYLDALLIAGTEPVSPSKLSIDDIFALKMELFDFFSEMAARRAAALSTSSSSTSNS